MILSVYIAVGMILSQIDDNGKWRPARYGSIPMDEREAIYSQPKLELFGLYWALHMWRIFLIGVKTLHVEVDAQYIEWMLNEPDLQPNAAINWWIQGILMFDFTLIHVPDTKFRGPDTIKENSRKRRRNNPRWWQLARQYALFSKEWGDLFGNDRYIRTIILYDAHNIPSIWATATKLDKELQQITHFLKTLEIPLTLTDTQARRQFIQKASRYFIQQPGDWLFWRNGKKSPLLVIFDEERQIKIMTQAHEKLGHKESSQHGKQSGNNSIGPISEPMSYTMYHLATHVKFETHGRFKSLLLYQHPPQYFQKYMWM